MTSAAARKPDFPPGVIYVFLPHIYICLILARLSRKFISHGIDSDSDRVNLHRLRLLPTRIHTNTVNDCKHKVCCTQRRLHTLSYNCFPLQVYTPRNAQPLSDALLAPALLLPLLLRLQLSVGLAVYCQMDTIALQHCLGQQTSPLLSAALQDRLTAGLCHYKYTYGDCSSYRCAVSQQKCTAILVKAKSNPHCSMLLCKTG